MTYTQAIQTMKTHKPGTPEHTEAWRAAEQAKNRNGGMPPLAGHTPGPWQLDEAYDATFSNDGRTESVLELTNGDHSETFGYICDGPNARLIAAAPELLAALESFVDQCDTPTEDMGGDWGSTEWCEWVGQAIHLARAAIAKAKGQ